MRDSQHKHANRKYKVLQTALLRAKSQSAQHVLAMALMRLQAHVAGGVTFSNSLGTQKQQVQVQQ